ncbi:MAG: DUF5666 domain-containing protein, partial [Candidatus Curtissbacteria bacterium]|nr:DUF5666 domain-containing protein [Candidatus Curtissbacteria bacterium]
MKKIFLFLLFFLIVAVPVQAQSTDNAASPAPTNPVTPAERLKEIRDKVEARIQEVKTQSTRRGFWGTLKQIANSTLVIDTDRGEVRVKTDDLTKITLNKKDIKSSDLGIGNFLIVVGDTDQTDTITATKILSYSKPPKALPLRQAIFGDISQIMAQDKIIVVDHPKKGLNLEIKISDKTIITKKSGDSVKKVKFEDLKVGDRVVIVGVKNGTDTLFTAKIMHVIPKAGQ